MVKNIKPGRGGILKSVLSLVLSVGLVIVDTAFSAGAPDDPSIGGGKHYSDQGGSFSYTGGDYSVNNIAELKVALDVAGDGDVVYLNEGTVIDFSDELASLQVAAGVTVAGNRGVNGSSGALIIDNNIHKNMPVFKVDGDGVRFTGFRLKGAVEVITKAGGNVPADPTVGIRSYGAQDLEVDNMELYNWTHAAVYIDLGSQNANIHHNSIHHNLSPNLGYGVVLRNASQALISHNLFDYNRHSIAGGGNPSQSYEAHSNIVFHHRNSHAFDMHGWAEAHGPSTSELAGDRIDIHDNTFLGASRAIIIRGRPSTGAFINNNSFFGATQAESMSQLYFSGNFTVSNNVYNSDGYFKFGDFDGGGSSLEGKRNDVFWTILSKWYVSKNGTEPWVRIGNSAYKADKLLLGDFDGNGIDDVLLAIGKTWKVSLDGSSPWQDINYLSSAIAGLRVGDFDGDGIADVVDLAGAQISWGGNTAFTTLNSSISFSSDDVVVDAGGDHTEDVIRSSSGGVEVSWGGGSSRQALGAHANRTLSVAYGDFDGNGTTDEFRITGGNSSWEVKYDSYDSSSVFVVLSSGHADDLSDLAFSDFDGDGKTDVMRSTGTKWQVSYGGVGSWVHLGTSSVGISSLALGDFNGDGKADIFTTGGGQWKVSWGGRSQWQTLSTSGYTLTNLVFTDINGDGQTDVVRGGSSLFVSLGGMETWASWPRP